MNNNIRIPSIVNLELTNKCNLKCIFCDHSVLKHSMRLSEMDGKTLIFILERLKGYNIYELGLVGLGEPLLDMNIERHLDIISRYKEHFKRISLNTNGILMDEEKSRAIIKSCVTLVTFSVNATNKRSYKELMGKDRFDLVVNNIKRFISILEEIKRQDLKVSIQVISSDLNDEDEIKKLFEKYTNDKIIIFSRFVFNKPSIGTRGSKLVKVNPIDKERRHPCWSLYSRVYIDVNGNVYPCTIGNDSYREKSNLNIGNIRGQDLVTIFNTCKMKTARKDAEKSKIPFVECEDCTLWELLPKNFYFQNNKWIFQENEPIRRKELDRNDLMGCGH